MKYIVIFFFLFLSAGTYAQTGIGTTTPDASAQLEVSSTTKGFLPPRMTEEQRDAIVSPATGLIIYNTTANTLEYKIASGWVSLISNPDGTNAGEMQYWDGSNWSSTTLGDEGQILTILNGLPVWQNSINNSIQFGITDLSNTGFTDAEINFSILGSLSTVTSSGIVYGTSPNPTVANSTIILGSSVGTLTGLTPSTTYYVRAFARNSLGIAYGNEITFTTKALQKASLITTALNNISPNSLRLGGIISSDGGSSIIVRGVVYGTSPNPTTANNLKLIGSGSGSYFTDITGLTTLTTYYVRAFASNAAGIEYGNEISITVPYTSLPILTTTTASNINPTTVTCEGNISSDGNLNVNLRGFAYGTSPNPTVANSTIILGSGVGTFSGTLTGLTPSTTYYVRAFASNFLGTTYGNEISFTTYSATNLPELGQPYLGGILAYLLQDGDPGYDASTPHGLIVSPMNLESPIPISPGSPRESTDINWKCAVLLDAKDSIDYNTIVTTGTAIGSGYQNTMNLVNTTFAGCEYTAASICADLVLNGYDDWFLPSRDEVHKMALLFYGITLYSEVMTFYIKENTRYWSSSLAPYYVRYNNVWEQVHGFPPASQYNRVYLWGYILHQPDLNFSNSSGGTSNVRAMRYF
jgi:hypothetical protein